MNHLWETDEEAPLRLSTADRLGANISIRFPFAGMVVPDKEGYFLVLLADQQKEELIAQKVRKNIYIPRYNNKHQSTAF